MKDLLIIILVLFFALGAEGTIEKNKKHYGVVKFYNENKRFGYIIDASTRAELYVYEEGLIDEIKKNDIVIFNIQDTRKGFEAINVRRK